MKNHSKISLCAGILAVFTWFTSTGAASVIASYDFGTDANTEGWTATSTSGFTTSAGFAVGTATGNDPQLLNNSVSLTVGAGETWDSVVFRIREVDDLSGLYVGSSGAPAFNTVGLVVQVNTTVISSGFTAMASGDNFYTITADIGAFAGTTITNIRVDPIGGAFSNSGSETNGNSFEVDFIRINAVPEPTTGLLGSLGMLALLRRRR